MNYSIVWDDTTSIVEFNGTINIDDIEKANKAIHGDNRIFASSASGIFPNVQRLSLHCNKWNTALPLI